MFGIQDRAKMKVKRYAFAAETQLIPILGVSSASNTMFILEEKKGYLTTKKESPDDFAIEVLGHCMEDPADPRHSIYHGDTIIVRPNVPVKDGDVVVARIGEESTIKRIFFNKKEGTIDCIITDHAPHAESEKDVELSKAPNGIIGFETALPAEIMNLVDPGHIDYLNLVRLTSYTPSKLLHIDNERGAIEAGKMADITIFDPNEEYVYTK